jgi:hypothetical protein
VRCSGTGCGRFDRNDIIAGQVLAGGAGITLDTAMNAEFDSNTIQAPVCQAASASGTYYGARVRGTGTLINNVIRDATCAAVEDVVHYDKVAIGPAAFDATIVHNTVEYTPCTACGERRGLGIKSGLGVLTGAEGYVNSNIIRNTAAGGISYPVYEYDTDSDLKQFYSNDLYDPTATALFYWHNSTSYGISNVNDSMKLAETDGNNLSADPQLTASWHIMATSPCRNAGSTSLSPQTDFERPTGQARPNPTDTVAGVAIPDVGADEFY